MAERASTVTVCTYLNEAVMEEETEDGGAHALLPGDGGLQHRPDGVVHAGARVGVEAGAQLRRRGAGGAGQQHKEQEESDAFAFASCS